MGVYGRASINSESPQALAVCDRCGALYNLVDLRWQYDWRGPQLQNLRSLVCQSCYDEPQPNGQRSILLPADPVPVQNARPEYYVPDSQPLSALGANPSPTLWEYSNQIGNLTAGGGVPAAFDGNPSKPVFMCATIPVANSSFNNYVGVNWSGNRNVPTPLSSLNSPVLTHTLSSYAIYAPIDVGINSTSYVVQGSQTGAGWPSWTTLSSGNISGTPGETITGVSTYGGRYQFHRVAFYGGTGSISVALVELSVSDGSSI